MTHPLERRTPSASSGTVAIDVNDHLYQFARWWLRILLAVAGVIFAGIVSILFGLASPGAGIPALDVVRQRPEVSIVAGTLLVLMTLAALIISRRPDRAAGGRQVARLVGATALSTMSTTLFVALLLLVLTRPAWCPAVLCPAPQVITNAAGVHDDNLEMYFTALQSATYVLPGDPAQYVPATAPQSVAAERLDLSPASAAAPYRVIVGIHSLQRGRFGIIIEEVPLVLVDVPPMPQPLNVWQAGAARSYDSNPFQVTYRGEEPDVYLHATYSFGAYAHVELAPGEADELDIQVDSQVPADIRFRVQVEYRVANEPQTHTLTLPRIFEVVFSNSSNWNVYRIADDRFVPAGK